MPAKYIAPIFFPLGKSTLGQIILILSKEKNLKAVEIGQRLKRDYSSRITPQAVHKTLRKLVSANILECDHYRYRISGRWIAGLKNFVARLK